jgi:hypothetical protein
MRNNGIGYKTIAREVGLTRDMVRNYCKSHDMAGYGKQIIIRAGNKEVCKYCLGTIEKAGTGRPKKFCSEKCRREWWKENSDLIDRKASAKYEMVCQHCGRIFISYGNKNRKYCSRQCYIKARFWTD